MLSHFDLSLYRLSTWIIPLLIAITFHEASHGFVARLFGDKTAWLAGRVTFNPLKHIDPFGTVLLPALLILMRAPFLFGYAKPVPVNFRALRNPKRDSIFVAAAGPAMNFALAILSALLFRLVSFVPPEAAGWAADNLNNALLINVLLAVFNLLPIPPLDGGRILVGLLPEGPSRSLASLEPYGMVILLAVLLVLPVLGQQTGVDLNFVWQFVARLTDSIISAILQITGAG
jgi:Zn-dependent protease